MKWVVQRTCAIKFWGHGTNLPRTVEIIFKAFLYPVWRHSSSVHLEYHRTEVQWQAVNKPYGTMRKTIWIFQISYEKGFWFKEDYAWFYKPRGLARARGWGRRHATQSLSQGPDAHLAIPVGGEVDVSTSFLLVLFPQATSFGRWREKGNVVSALQRVRERRNCLAQNYNLSSNFPDHGSLLRRSLRLLKRSCRVSSLMRICLAQGFSTWVGLPFGARGRLSCGVRCLAAPLASTQ